MDVVSHGIIGRLLVTKSNRRKDLFLISFFAVLPDLFQIPLYLFLGCIKNRPLCLPLNSDWHGFRELYPAWLLLWEIPHSFLFLLVGIVPIVFIFRLPKMVIAAYFSHIFVDLFTHSGEWSVKPFFPAQVKVEGFTDAWAWPFFYYPISWAILSLAVVLSDKVRLKSKTSR